ncbi:MAG: SRPBCC domain-containing protein [Planctomycetaceae bacterium]
MAETTKAETTKLVNRIVINAPIQKVWDTLTKSGELQPFFFNSVLHTTSLAPGAPVRMRSPDGKYTGVVGEVLELDPPYRYSMTFKFTNFDDPVCKVTHVLKEIEGGTEYTLISEEIPKGTKTEKQMAQGGSFIVRTLKGVVETGRPPFGSRMLLTLIKCFAWATPKVCLSENWPLDRKIT